jgi:methionine-S-sulfoxide reductase
VGKQYRSVIFNHNDNQKKIALKIKNELEASGVFKSKVVTEIAQADHFYPAEDYHQDYHKKNPYRPLCHILREKSSF